MVVPLIGTWRERGADEKVSVDWGGLGLRRLRLRCQSIGSYQQGHKWVWSLRARLELTSQDSIPGPQRLFVEVTDSAVVMQRKSVGLEGERAPTKSCKSCLRCFWCHYCRSKCWQSGWGKDHCLCEVFLPLCCFYEHLLGWTLGDWLGIWKPCSFGRPTWRLFALTEFLWGIWKLGPVRCTFIEFEQRGW